MEHNNGAPADAPQQGLRRRASDSAQIGPLRRFVYECLAAALVLPMLVAWLATQSGLWHANALVHDAWLALQPSPPADGVVVIALDEHCPPGAAPCADLAMRTQELLLHLRQHQVRSVLLDDRLLKPLGKVALTSTPAHSAATNWATTDAMPVFHTASLATHGLPADLDGVSRSLLTHVSGNGAAQTHPVLEAAGVRSPEAGWPSALHLRWRSGADSPPVWRYADVLMGTLPDGALTHKRVVVGPRTSALVGSHLVVRIGATIHTLPLPDAYAQVMDSLEHPRWVRHLSDVGALVWAVVPLWLTAWLCLRRPEHAAPVVMAMALVVVALSGYALLQLRWWLPVATPLTGMMLFLLICSWRRSHALSELFSRRIERLDGVLAQMPVDADPRLQPLAPRTMYKPQQVKVEVLDQTLERLEAQHQIQRRMQQQRDRWLAFLSHDLRAPQSNILSLLELREHGVEGMTDERFYGGIRVQVDRTLRLAEGFVDLLRAESDTLNRQDCTLEQLAQEAAERCWPQAQAAQVRIVQRGTVNDVCGVYGDPELLTRAMVNMLGNALRHSAPGSQVDVCVAHDPRAGVVAWSVRDNGPGMDSTTLSELLEALDSHTWVRPRSKNRGQRTHGLGLGLLIAHTVVVRHQGELHAIATPGEGCQFLMVLPAAPALAPVSTLSPENPPVGIRALQT